MKFLFLFFLGHASDFGRGFAMKATCPDFPYGIHDNPLKCEEIKESKEFHKVSGVISSVICGERTEEFQEYIATLVVNELSAKEASFNIRFNVGNSREKISAGTVIYQIGQKPTIWLKKVGTAYETVRVEFRGSDVSSNHSLVECPSSN